LVHGVIQRIWAVVGVLVIELFQHLLLGLFNVRLLLLLLDEGHGRRRLLRSVSRIRVPEISGKLRGNK
jgi:hypothetical protein